MTRNVRLALVLAALAAPLASPARAQSVNWKDTGPPPGIYMHWYEPSFYTGFAPRTQDPGRAQLHLGRGNQLRLTMVLGDAEIDGYLEDLALRRRTYRELVDAGTLELTQNSYLEEFEQRLDALKLGELVAARATMEPGAYRTRSLEVMGELNPGRVRHVRVPLSRAAADWKPALAAMTADPRSRVAAANAALPGRLGLDGLTQELEAALDAAAKLAASGASLDAAAGDFVAKASAGRYAVRAGSIDAWEHTAIYPAGTVDRWTSYEGRQIPDFGRTGVWPLIPRMQGKGVTGMVDYIATNPAYGFLPNLGYEHAGGIEYNSYHNAGARAPLSGCPFLPASWKKAPASREPKRPYLNLWIASRGPVSHGCTRTGSGYIAEIRHMLPSDSKQMEKVRTFRNLPQCYDVFDVEGDGKPEVMGLRYFLAYKASEQRTPSRAYASNEREPFYQWLYGADLGAIDEKHASLKDVETCTFSGKSAAEGRTWDELPLHEPEAAKEYLQFYRVKGVSPESARGFDFSRELLRVGVGYDADDKKLLMTPKVAERR